jgi:hypothetical protein
MSIPTRLAPPAAHHPSHVAATTILTLSVVEGKRLLRNPVLLAGAACGVALTILRYGEGEPAQPWDSFNYTALSLYWAPLYLGAFVAANMAALRERETTTAETFRASPVSFSERTLALLGAGLVPTALATVLSALYLGVIAGAGGATVHGARLTPSIIEMALIPAITATSFVSGVALARMIGSRTVGVIWGSFATFTLYYIGWIWGWFPAYFVTPYATSLRAVPLGTAISADAREQWDPIPPDEHHPIGWAIERDVGIVGWHIAYLAGVTLLLAAYAVRRSGPDRRIRWMLVSGAVLTIAGLALQMAAFGLPLSMPQGLPGL